MVRYSGFQREIIEDYTEDYWCFLKVFGINFKIYLEPIPRQWCLVNAGSWHLSGEMYMATRIYYQALLYDPRNIMFVVNYYEVSFSLQWYFCCFISL